MEKSSPILDLGAGDSKGTEIVSQLLRNTFISKYHQLS